MAVETFPSFLQDEEYSAETLRHVFGTLLARGSAIGSISGGLVAATDMQVTAGSGMQVLVATGEAWIPGSSVSTQGGYLGRVTSSTALAISAASESNPRIDTIIAQVKDKAVAGGTDSFSVSVVTGTATSGATLANKLGAGSVPASSLVLAYVLVPAKAVSIVSGDIENVGLSLSLGLTAPVAAESITGEKLAKALVTSASLNYSGVKAKGFTNIATEQSRSGSYGVLGTPDEVTVELAANGLLAVSYAAMWKPEPAGAIGEGPRAAIFVNGNQLRMATEENSPVTTAAVPLTSGTGFQPLVSCVAGLAGIYKGTPAYTGDVATGQVAGLFSRNGFGIEVNGTPTTMYPPGPAALGGECLIDGLPAGTYTISIRYKTESGGNVTVKNRRLRVRAISYA